MRKMELLPTRDCETGYGPDAKTHNSHENSNDTVMEWRFYWPLMTLVRIMTFYDEWHLQSVEFPDLDGLLHCPPVKDFWCYDKLPSFFFKPQMECEQGQPDDKDYWSADNISYPLFVHVIRTDIYGGVPYHMRPEAECDTAPHHRYLPYCVEQTGDNEFII